MEGSIGSGREVVKFEIIWSGWVRAVQLAFEFVSQLWRTEFNSVDICSDCLLAYCPSAKCSEHVTEFVNLIDDLKGAVPVGL